MQGGKYTRVYIMLRARGTIQKMSRLNQTPHRERAQGRTAGAVSPSHQALKSERTRAELLRAAEVIFARDGFEASRIEDIAAEAGRSRGAFYANFASQTE